MGLKTVVSGAYGVSTLLTSNEGDEVLRAIDIAAD